MKAKRALFWARIAIYVVVLVVLAVFALRYDILRLPAAGCSPLRDFQPGQRLLLDRWSKAEQGDAVLFEMGDELLLGRVFPFPPDTRPAAGPASEDSLWIVADAPDCPAKDSRALGPIPRAAVRARVAAGLPW